MTLTGKQRRYLRGLGHHLDPVIHLGKGGVSRGVIDRTREALEAHELIKIRCGDGYEEKAKTGAEELASSTDSTVAGVIGHTALLYRERDEDPDIKLPKPESSRD